MLPHLFIHCECCWLSFLYTQTHTHTHVSKPLSRHWCVTLLGFYTTVDMVVLLARNCVSTFYSAYQHAWFSCFTPASRVEDDNVCVYAFPRRHAELNKPGCSWARYWKLLHMCDALWRAEHTVRYLFVFYFPLCPFAHLVRCSEVCKPPISVAFLRFFWFVTTVYAVVELPLCGRMSYCSSSFCLNCGVAWCIMAYADQSLVDIRAP